MLPMLAVLEETKPAFNLTNTTYGFVALAVFFLAYLLVALEERKLLSGVDDLPVTPGKTR